MIRILLIFMMTSIIQGCALSTMSAAIGAGIGAGIGTSLVINKMQDYKYAKNDGHIKS